MDALGVEGGHVSLETSGKDDNSMPVGSSILVLFGDSFNPGWVKKVKVDKQY